VWEQDLRGPASLQKRKDGDEDVEISGLTEDAAGTSGAGDEAVSRGRSSGEEQLRANVIRALQHPKRSGLLWMLCDPACSSCFDHAP
jgi:hypothetical protein